MMSTDRGSVIKLKYHEKLVAGVGSRVMRGNADGGIEKKCGQLEGYAQRICLLVTLT